MTPDHISRRALNEMSAVALGEQGSGTGVMQQCNQDSRNVMRTSAAFVGQLTGSCWAGFQAVPCKIV